MVQKILRTMQDDLKEARERKQKGTSFKELKKEVQEMKVTQSMKDDLLHNTGAPMPPATPAPAEEKKPAAPEAFSLADMKFLDEDRKASAQNLRQELEGMGGKKPELPADPPTPAFRTQESEKKSPLPPVPPAKSEPAAISDDLEKLLAESKPPQSVPPVTVKPPVVPIPAPLAPKSKPAAPMPPKPLPAPEGEKKTVVMPKINLVRPYEPKAAPVAPAPKKEEKKEEEKKKELLLTAAAIREELEAPKKEEKKELMAGPQPVPKAGEKLPLFAEKKTASAGPYKQDEEFSSLIQRVSKSLAAEPKKDAPPTATAPKPEKDKELKDLISRISHNLEKEKQLLQREKIPVPAVKPPLLAESRSPAPAGTITASKSAPMTSVPFPPSAPTPAAPKPAPAPVASGGMKVEAVSKPVLPAKPQPPAPKMPEVIKPALPEAPKPPQSAPPVTVKPPIVPIPAPLVPENKPLPAKPPLAPTPAPKAPESKPVPLAPRESQAGLITSKVSVPSADKDRAGLITSKESSPMQDHPPLRPSDASLNAENRLVFDKQEFYSSVHRKIQPKAQPESLDGLKDIVKEKEVELSDEEEKKMLRKQIINKYNVKTNSMPVAKIAIFAVLLLVTIGVSLYLLLPKTPAPKAPVSPTPQKEELLTGESISAINQLIGQEVPVKMDTVKTLNYFDSSIEPWASLAEGGIVRLRVDYNEHDVMLPRDEALKAVLGEERFKSMPSAVTQLLKSPYTLVAFKNNDTIRLGLVLQFDASKETDLRQAMLGWEETETKSQKMYNVLKALFVSSKVDDKKGSLFQQGTYNDIDISYANLPDATTSLDYFFYEDMLVFATSKDTTFEMIDLFKG